MRRKKLILVGSVCVCLFVAIGGYLATGSFFAKEETKIDEAFFLGSLNSKNPDVYQLSEDELNEFISFYEPLLKDYMEGRIIKEEYEERLYKYYIDVKVSDGKEETKNKKLAALTIREKVIREGYNNVHVLPVVVEIVKRNPFTVTQEEKDLIQRSGLHPYDVNTYIEGMKKELYDTSENGCNAVETLESHGVKFIKGSGIYIKHSDLTIKKISEDPCLQYSSAKLLGDGILNSIALDEAYQVGNYVIVYDIPPARKTTDQGSNVSTVMLFEHDEADLYKTSLTWTGAVSSTMQMIEGAADEYSKTLEELRTKSWKITGGGFYHNLFNKWFSKNPSNTTLSDEYQNKLNLLWKTIFERLEYLKSLGVSHEKYIDPIKAMRQDIANIEKATFLEVEKNIDKVKHTAYLAAASAVTLGATGYLATMAAHTATATAIANGTMKVAELTKMARVGYEAGKIVKSSYSLLKLTAMLDLVVGPALKAGFNARLLKTNLLDEYMAAATDGVDMFITQAPMVALIPVGLFVGGAALGGASAGVTAAASKVGMAGFANFVGGPSAAYLAGNGLFHTVVSLWFLKGVTNTTLTGGAQAWQYWKQAVEAEQKYYETGDEQYYKMAEANYRGCVNIGVEAGKSAYFMATLALGSLQQGRAFFTQYQQQRQAYRSANKVATQLQAMGATTEEVDLLRRYILKHRLLCQ